MFRKILIVVIFFILLYPTSSYAQSIKELFMTGIDAMQTDKNDEAIAAFEKIIVIKPDFAPAYNFLGMAYKNKGKDGHDIIPYFQKALAYDPNYAMAYDNIGKAYYGMGDMKKALEYCRKAIQYDPNLLTAHLSLGWIYLLGKQQPVNAIKHFKKVVNSNPLPYACLGLGLAYFQNNQTALVLEMITYLRQQGEENYAKHLEQMIRQGRYIAPNVGTSVLDAPQPRAQSNSTSITSNVPSTNQSLQDIKSMPVYLKAKMPGTEDFNQEPQKPSGPLSGTDRIRAMQERGADLNY